MTMEEQFSVISGFLMNYETGDFILLSDLSDAFVDLKDHFLDCDEALKLLDTLRNCVTEEMKKSGLKGFKEGLSAAVDLLQNLANAFDEESRADAIKAIKAFACRFSDKKAGAGTPEDKRAEETMQVFLAEAKDRLANAQEIILKLEEKSDDPSLLQDLFRIFHTIKGECGFLKIATLGELTHNLESVLDQLRSGTTAIAQEHIDILLEGIDKSKEILTSIENKDVVLFSDISLDNYIDRLKSVLKQPASNLGEFLVAEGKMQENEVLKVLQKQKESAYSKRFGEIAVKENFLSSEELQEALDKQKEAKSGEGPKLAERVDPVIKVRASKVNFLVDMIGELLIAMGQVTGGGSELMQMRKITRSLQFAAMELRTDSLHNLFGNLRRAVRDLSRQLGKKVQLLCSGEDLEIDRNLIEKLEEPLMHLIRNSLDHGLGSEEERLAAGKQATGTVNLKAERQGNSIVIIVRDDGRGLNREKILAKAISKNLVSKDAGEKLSDSEVFNMVFVSGFSTHDNVSIISGRGVGMDIVRAVVTANRGRIELDSVKDQYTEFRLIFPLSTAIIDGMITRVSDNLFIFPISSVVESLKITKDMVSSINNIVDIANIRGESIPVIGMHKVFGIAPINDSPAQIGVICENSELKKFMFVLDEVIAKREVVIKSLGSRFKEMQGVSSATVLSGGKIGLVLDIDEIISISLLTEKN